MIQVHATKKLFERLPLEDGRLKVKDRSDWLHRQPNLDINPLSGWHGNLISLQRRNCVLMVHDATRFPILLPALTKPDYVNLSHHFVDGFMNTLLKCGAEEKHMDAAQQHLRPLQFDTQCDRSIQGTLNRMKGDVGHLLWHDQVNIADMTGYRLGAWLAGMGCNAKDHGYIKPDREMLRLLTRLSSTI